MPDKLSQPDLPVERSFASLNKPGAPGRGLVKMQNNVREVGLPISKADSSCYPPASQRTNQPNRHRQFELQTIWDFEGDYRDVIDVALDISSISDWCGDIFMRVETLGEFDGNPGQRVWAYTKGVMPHSFVFQGIVTRLVPDNLIEIDISGDFEGTAVIEVRPLARRTRVIFTWRIDIRHRLIGRLSRLLPAVFLWNHRWAVRKSCEAMQRELIRRRRFSNELLVSNSPSFPHNIPCARSFLGKKRRRSIVASPRKKKAGQARLFSNLKTRNRG